MSEMVEFLWQTSINPFLLIQHICLKVTLLSLPT